VKIISEDYVRQLEESLKRNQELEKRTRIINKTNDLKRRTKTEKEVTFYENPTHHFSQTIKKADEKLENILNPKNVVLQMDIKEQLDNKKPDEIIDVMQIMRKMRGSNIEKLINVKLQ